MSNPRDEHFMGFARAVVKEITGRDEYDECDMEEVIAQRAYDLVQHAIFALDQPAICLEGKHMADIPDLPYVCQRGMPI